MNESIDSPKSYFVLGASGGIGSALVAKLHEAGARVALAGRNRETLEPLAARYDAPLHVLDARDAKAVEDAVKSAAETFGGLGGVVNCVGSILLKPAHLTTPAEWDETLAQNVTTAFNAVRAAARAIKGPGSVVLCSSAAAKLGLANHDAIAAAKAGVAGLTISAAATYAARGLRINAVAPGLVATPLTERITGSTKGREASLALHPLGRLGEPEDVASAIAWLLDPRQSWVTGQVIGVDGGLGGLKVRGG